MTKIIISFALVAFLDIGILELDAFKCKQVISSKSSSMVGCKRRHEFSVDLRSCKENLSNQCKQSYKAEVIICRMNECMSYYQCIDIQLQQHTTATIIPTRITCGRLLTKRVRKRCVSVIKATYFRIPIRNTKTFAEEIANVVALVKVRIVTWFCYMAYFFVTEYGTKVKVYL